MGIDMQIIAHREAASQYKVHSLFAKISLLQGYSSVPPDTVHVRPEHGHVCSILARPGGNMEHKRVPSTVVVV